MAFKTKPRGGGDFFNGKDYLDAKAVLFDVHDIRDGVNKFGTEGKYLTVDATIFHNDKQLLGEEDPEIKYGVVIGGGALGRGLVTEGAEAGEAFPCRLVQIENKRGTNPLIVSRALDRAVEEAVEVYYNKRQSALSEELSFLDD